MLRFLVKENNNLSNYDIDLDEVGTMYIGYSVDKYDCKERQKFKIVMLLEKKTTIDIELEKILFKTGIKPVWDI